MSYYYLSASLPAISLESAPELSLEDFKKLCSEHLSASDMNVLDNLLSGNEADINHPFAREWSEKITQVRNATAKIRASRLQLDPSDYIREQPSVSLMTDKKVADAFTLATPADREHAIDKHVWNEIDELAGYDPFSTSAILAYGLKLKLAERWAGMTPEDGQETAERIINAEPGDDDRTLGKQQEQETV